jgi:RNA polymerase sigma-70 factor (ECF subfamily)
MTRTGYETLVDQTTGRVVLARSLSQEQLTDGARQGFNAYIGELERRFGPGVERAIRHLAGSASQEIVDDVFMSLPRRLDGYAEEGKFEQWLAAVAFNVARTRARSERRRPDNAEPVADRDRPRDATGAARVIEEETMERAAAHLPASEREAWLLAFKGHEPHEIAQMLGISANAAAVRIHRARKRLQELMERDD